MCYVHFAPENPEDGKQRYDIWLSPRRCPCIPTQTGGMQHNCAMAHSCVNDDLRADGLWKGWGFRVGTRNVDSLTGSTGEVVEALSDRKVGVACIQETQWKGGCTFYRAKGQRYKLFWMGDEERSDSVGIFVAEKWVDSVVSVRSRCKRWSWTMVY